MVYQQFINYPHLSVFENIASPLRVARVPASQVKSRVGRIADLLRLSELLDRRTSELSGGQQQRTALALVLMAMPLLIPWNVVGAMWNLLALPEGSGARRGARRGAACCASSRRVAIACSYRSCPRPTSTWRGSRSSTVRCGARCSLAVAVAVLVFRYA